jgi:hypothetical protein
MKEAYEEEIRRVRGEVEREKRRRGFEGREGCGRRGLGWWGRRGRWGGCRRR